MQFECRNLVPVSRAGTSWGTKARRQLRDAFEEDRSHMSPAQLGALEAWQAQHGRKHAALDDGRVVLRGGAKV